MAGKSEIQKMIDGVDDDIQQKRDEIDMLLVIRERLEDNEKERQARKAGKAADKESAQG